METIQEPGWVYDRIINFYFMKIDNHASKHNGSTVELLKKTSPPKTNHVKKQVVIIKKG